MLTSLCKYSSHFNRPPCTPSATCLSVSYLSPSAVTVFKLKTHLAHHRMTPTRTTTTTATKVEKNLSAPLILRLILFPKVVPKTSHRFYLTFDAPPSEIMTMRERPSTKKSKEKKRSLNGKEKLKPAEVKEKQRIRFTYCCGAVIIISKVDRVIKQWSWTKLAVGMGGGSGSGIDNEDCD